MHIYVLAIVVAPVPCLKSEREQETTIKREKKKCCEHLNGNHHSRTEHIKHSMDF